MHWLTVLALLAVTGSVSYLAGQAQAQQAQGLEISARRSLSHSEEVEHAAEEPASEEHAAVEHGEASEERRGGSEFTTTALMDGETTPLAEVRDAFDASLEGGSIRPLISTLHVLLNNPTEIAVLLGMVVTGFFLRALWDAIAFFSDRILRRLLRCIVWALHQAYPWLFQILPDEEADNNVPEHALCIDYVLLTRISWTEACKFSRLTRWGAPLVALLRLFLWHWLQPLGYLLAIIAYSDDITGLHLALAMIVTVRELIYVVLTLACAWVHPAYLLVDTAATWRERKPLTAIGFILLFVLSPQKFVWMALLAGTRERSKWSVARDRLRRSRPRAEGQEGANDSGNGATATDVARSNSLRSEAGSDTSEPNFVKHASSSGLEEESEIQENADLKAIREQRLREIKDVETLATAQLGLDLRFDSWGRLNLAFGEFLVALDVVGMAAIVLSVFAEQPAPLALVVGYSLTAIGGGYILVFTLFYWLMRAFRASGRSVSKESCLYEVDTTIRLFLVMMGAARTGQPKAPSAVLPQRLRKADGSDGDAVADVFNFADKEVVSVDNLFAVDGNKFDFNFTECEEAYGDTSTTTHSVTTSFELDTKRQLQPKAFTLKMEAEPCQQWGINWGGAVQVKSVDGTKRMIVLPGELTYDPAGVTGDAHASERIGKSCACTQLAITGAMLHAANLGASLENLELIQKETRDVIRRYHGRLTLWKYMLLQIQRAVYEQREAPPYPEFVLAAIRMGEIDPKEISQKRMRHTRAFLQNWVTDDPQPPLEYFKKVSSKDKNGVLPEDVQQWLITREKSEPPSATNLLAYSQPRLQRSHSNLV